MHQWLCCSFGSLRQKDARCSLAALTPHNLPMPSVGAGRGPKEVMLTVLLYSPCPLLPGAASCAIAAPQAEDHQLLLSAKRRVHLGALTIIVIMLGFLTALCPFPRTGACRSTLLSNTHSPSCFQRRCTPAGSLQPFSRAAAACSPSAPTAAPTALVGNGLAPRTQSWGLRRNRPFCFRSCLQDSVRMCNWFVCSLLLGKGGGEV